MQDNKIYSKLANTIVGGIESISNNATSTAQYDKTYQCIILGINQLFVDGVLPEDKNIIIATYSIPKTSEGIEFFYTIKINGKHYCVKTKNHFALYEEVIVTVPKGDWSRLRLAHANEKEVDNKIKQVRYTTSRMYYGDEEYRLQRGNDMRILAVTQGNKCAVIEAETKNESEIMAFSEVIKGLKEFWTIEYDAYIPQDGYLADPMFGCPFVSDIEFIVDYGDKTEMVEGVTTQYNWNIAAHTYQKKGLYHIRIKAEKAKSVNLTQGYFSIYSWTEAENYDGKGIRTYIGGNIETVIGADSFVTRVAWGENIKELIDSSFWGRNTGILELSDISLPPFVTTVTNSMRYMCGNYLYIPDSCILINSGSFQYCSYENIDISPNGDTLQIEGFCFTDFSSDAYGTPYGKINGLRLPNRISPIVPSNSNFCQLFRNCGLKHCKFEYGWTKIPNNLLSESNIGGYNLGSEQVYASPKLYVFIPTSVKTIESYAFPTSCSIVYQGNLGDWNKISKGYFNGDSEPDVICLNVNNTEFDNTFNTLVKLNTESLQGGKGIKISGGLVSLKPASDQKIGGIIVSGGLKTDGAGQGYLSLKGATSSEIGGLILSDGLVPIIEDDGSNAKSTDYIRVAISDGLEFFEKNSETTNVTEQAENIYGGRKFGVKLGKCLGFEVDANDNQSESTGAVALRISEDNCNGLEYEEVAPATELTRAEYALAMSLATTEKYGTIKLGENLELNPETGKVDAKGGSDYIAGQGIDIVNISEQETSSINAKIGTGLEFGTNKEMKVKIGEGLNINVNGAIEADERFLIMLTEEQVDSFIYNYELVPYKSGSKVIINNSKNDLIIQGVVAESSQVSYENKTTMGGVTLNMLSPSDNTKIETHTFTISENNGSGNATSKSYYIKDNETVKNSFTLQNDGEAIGFAVQWNTYTATPTAITSVTPYGYVGVNILFLYRTRADVNIGAISAGSGSCPFATSAELQYAMGITTVSENANTLYNIEQTITEA